MAEFKRGDFSTCDAPHPGQPKTETTLEIIDQINELILEDRRISAKSIAEQLGISCGRVGSIIHHHFEGKTPREGHQGGLVLARQCPGLPGTCKPEETGLPGLPVS